MTQLETITSRGDVYRWSFVAGYPRCVEDALLSGDSGAMAALQRTAAMQAMLDLVEPYEAAQAVLAAGEPDNGQPRQIADPAWIDPEDGSTAPMIDNPDWSLLPREIETTDSEGHPQTAPEPRWQAFDAAAATVAGASDSTIAHARWRAGEPIATETEAHDAWQAVKDVALAELDRLAALPLAVDPRPVPEEISRRQFAYAAAVKGLMSQADALAFVNTGALPASVEAVLSSPAMASVQFAARMALASNSFRRHHPTTLQFLPLLGIDAPTGDDVWRIGASVP